MSDYERLDQKLRDNMYTGNMHVCIRDVGREIGGCRAAGRIDDAQFESLRRTCISLANNKAEAERKWDKETAFGMSQPLPRSTAYAPTREYRAIGFDEVINTDDYKIVDKNWIEEEVIAEPDKWNPCKELAEYISLLFDPEDFVGYCTDPFQRDGEDKWFPTRGTYTQTASNILKHLKRGKFDDAVGTLNNDKSGAWIRINPLDGKGVKDENVVDYRYALVESDDMSIEEQVAVYKKMELPCVCIVHSGGKSAHAIVRINANSLDEYRKRVDFLFDVCRNNGLSIDKANRNPSRYSRMPGVMRDGKKQYIIERECGKKSWEEWENWIKDLNDNLPDFEPLTDEEFANPPPLAPELIAGILRVNHKMCIAGPSKAGKSFALIQLAIAVAEGIEWFGRKCRQGRVLYINLELDPVSCLHRFIDVYKALEIKGTRKDFIDRWNMRGYGMPLDKLAPKLIRRAKDKGYALIIIDPIYKVLTGDENNAYDMSVFNEHMASIGRQCDCAIVFCHHHSKGFQGGKRSMDRASGSGVFARDPDAMIDLVQLDDKSARDVLRNRMECDAMWAEAERQAFDENDLSDIGDDVRIVSKNLLDALAKVFSTDQMIEIERAQKAAAAKCDEYTSWRASFTVREFATPQPQDFWFKWPRHILDEEKLLESCMPEGEESFFKHRKENYAKGRDKVNSSRKDAKMNKFEAFKQTILFEPQREWKVEEAVKLTQTTEGTLRRYCKSLGWEINKGVIKVTETQEDAE